VSARLTVVSLTRKLLLSLALVAPATGIAHAQGSAPGSTAPNTPTAAVAKAQQQVSQAKAARDAIAKKYAVALAAIDTLKQQKSGFRRDRELRAALANSHELATALTAATSALAKAQAALNQLAPPAVSTKRIVLPSTQIDPLADPEELEMQAQALKQAESDIGVQLAALTDQEKAAGAAVNLRRQHLRAQDVSVRDDDQARGQKTPNGKLGAQSEDSPSPSPPVEGDAANLGGARGLDSRALQLAGNVLVDLIDAKQGLALKVAATSSDPEVRLLAAQNARVSVATKLAQLRKQRQAIEARAAQLRK
jgi:hypothetical protein